MIITETIAINGKEFTKNYSDTGHPIQKDETEEGYAEAINPINKNCTIQAFINT